MIRALIPTIQQTKSNNRRISGSVLHGQVVATRVSGGVDSGRDATFEPTWEVIRQETLDEPGTLQESLSGVPLSFESQTLYRLREVRVVDGGDYSQRPRLRVLDADQTYRDAILTANVAGETLTSVTVEDSGAYSQQGRVVAFRAPRSYYVDCVVRGRGGRAHRFADCAAAEPFRIGDAVVLEVPNGTEVNAVLVQPQVPRRPLIHRDAQSLIPERVSDTRVRVGSRINYSFLGWPQAWVFDVQASAALRWSGDANWHNAAPTPATLTLQMWLQRMTGGSWQDYQQLEVAQAHAYLQADTDGGSARWQWAGVYQLDDGAAAVRDTLGSGVPLAIAVYLDAGSDSVTWLATGGSGWQASDPSLLTVGADYTIQAVELGGGTH